VDLDSFLYVVSMWFYGKKICGVLFGCFFVWDWEL